MPTNLEIQEQIKILLEEQNELLEQQTKISQDNLSIAKSMVEAIGKISYRDVTTQLGEMHEAQNQAAESAQTLGTESQSTQEKVVKALREASGQTELLGVSVTKAEKKMAKLGFIGASALDGFISGLKLTVNALQSAGSLVGGFVGRLFDLGKSIITAPFKILNGLIGDMEGGSNDLQQALEDIRKEFGNIREAGARAIVDTAKGMKGELANTGLSVGRVFGTLAERLRTIAEYAKNLGPLFGVLAGQFVKNSEAIGAYFKGLGLTAEGQKAVAARAYATGQDITEVSRQIANYSLQLGRDFGLNAKEISRDIGEMMADFSHFGNLAPRELAEISTYTRRLGIDLKALAGVIDGLSNFEDAAKSAAQLSQAFGLNIDAIQLMQEQNPARQVEMLRKSFFAAGRSIENMTRQERRLLAQQTHLDESTLDLVFSAKNQGLSYDQVQKKGDAARKKQLSQAEAMQKLAGAIERLVRSGSSGAGGFFDRFVQGFERGIKRSSEFRHLMRNLSVDLRATYLAGMRVGQEFVKAFPGVKAFLGGLAELFDPRRFRRMLNQIVDGFKEFFKLLTTNRQAALPFLLDRLKKSFFEWFDSNSPAGRQILNGFRSFFKALSTIAGSLLKEALRGITVGIRFIIDILTGKKSLSGIAATGRGAGGFIATLLMPMLAAVREMGPPLWNAIRDLFGVLMDRVRGYLLKNWATVLTVFFAPSILGAFGRSFTAALSTQLAGSLVKALTGSAVKGAITSGASSAVSAIGSVAGGISATTVAVYALIAAVVALTAGFLLFPRQTQKVVDSITAYVQKGAEKIFEFVGLAIGYLVKGIMRIPALVGGTFSNIPALLQKGIQFIANKLPEALEKAFFAIGGIIKGAINGIINGLERGLTRALPQYAGQIKGVFATIRNVVSKAFEVISTVAKAFFSVLRVGFRVIGAVAGVVFRVVATIVQTQVRIMIRIWQTLSPYVIPIFNTIRSVVVTVFTAIVQQARTMYDSFVAIFNLISPYVQTVVGFIIRYLVKGVEGFVAGVRQWISLIGSFFSTIGSAASAVWQGIQTAWTGAVNFFTGIGQGIRNALSGPLDFIKNKFEEVFGVARNAVQSVSNVVNRIFGNSVHDVIARDLDQTRPVAERWSNNLVNAAQKAEEGIANSSRNITTSVQESMSRSPGGGAAVTGIAARVNPTAVTSLNDSISSLTALNNQLTTLSETRANAAIPVIQRMIQDVNTISRSLSQIQPVNINVGLQRLAGNIGLGNNDEFTINHRNFNVNITLNVKVDAADLERILIERPNTRIAHTTSTRQGTG